MAGFIEEFKKFALRGNVVDLAVGVVIGGAFGKIVNGIVSNIISPIMGCLTGGSNFSNLFISLGSKPVETLAEAQAANVPVIAYGALIDTIIEFLIIAFSLFVVVRQINRLMPAPPPPAEPRRCPYCREVIAADATRCPHCTAELETKEKE